MKKRQHLILSQNFISTCRYLDDHCQYSSLFSYIKIYRQRHSTEGLQGKQLNQKHEDKQRNATIWIRTSPPSSLQLQSFPWDLVVRGTSLVDSMRRSATGQMQEPEDDIARITAFELSDLVLSFLLDEARLICGTTLCRKTQALLL